MSSFLISVETFGAACGGGVLLLLILAIKNRGYESNLVIYLAGAGAILWLYLAYPAMEAERIRRQEARPEFPPATAEPIQLTQINP